MVSSENYAGGSGEGECQSILLVRVLFFPYDRMPMINVYNNIVVVVVQ